MKQSMRCARWLALGCFLVLSGMAMSTSAGVGAIPSASVVYYDDAGNVVGVRMWGCGDPGWGEVTLRSKYYPGCIM